MNDAAPALLEMRGIGKSFGAPVLRGVDFSARAGEVHALMGENGAGKSTLMRILAGVVRPDAGEIWFGGRRLAGLSPSEVMRAGIASVHQEPSVALPLGVAENLFLGAEPTRAGVWIDRRRMRAEAARVLMELGADFGPEARVGDLAPAQRQLVEIGRAVLYRGRLLMMDEPTASLSAAEAERLFALIRRLAGQGTAIVYISHRLAEVRALARRVTVLRDGEVTGRLEGEEIEESRIAQLMVGRPLRELFGRGERARGGAVVLRTRGLGDGVRVRGVDVEVRAGEVLGLTGLVGAGRTEFARLLFGAERPPQGRIELEGREVTIADPAAAIRLGLGYVPEDRMTQGLFLPLSVEANCGFIRSGREAPLGLLRRGRLRREGRRAIGEFGIHPADPAREVRLLSGGNQQKVLLARWLSLGLKVLILDEPTRGVDIGAKAEIYRMIDDFAARGGAVLLISSELVEVIAVCDRVAVMRQGRIAGTVDRREERLTESRLLGLAMGTAA